MVDNGEASVAVHGPGEWDMAVLWLDPDEIVPNAENPNEQDDATFNALVESIRTEGWTGPVSAVFDEIRGKYEIVGGEHRWRAARVLGCKVPVLALPADQFDRDRRDWNMVKDNMLHGRLNPEKFTHLYKRLQDRYDSEVLQSLMGFTSEEAFKRVYKEVRRQLPPDLAKALAGTKDELKTIDDLSNVLNRLFRDHGENLDSNMMVFSWGGKQVMWIRADKALWAEASDIAVRVAENGLDMTEVMYDALKGLRGADHLRHPDPDTGVVTTPDDGTAAHA